MTVTLAIVLSMIGSALTNAGYIFQKRGVNKTSLGHGKASFRYIFNGTWIFGLSLMTFGWFFYIEGMRYAPVSAIQPLQGAGFLVFAALSIFYLKEKTVALEWAAIGCLIAGVVLVGTNTSGMVNSRVFHLLPMVILNLSAALLILLIHFLKYKKIRIPIRNEILWGITSGTTMGFAALYTKAMLIVAENNDFLPACAVLLPVVILFNIAGILFTQRGFQTGSAIIVISVQSFFNSAMPVAGGMLAFSEHLSGNLFSAFLQASGFILAITGSVVISRFSRNL